MNLTNFDISRRFENLFVDIDNLQVCTYMISSTGYIIGSDIVGRWPGS